MTHTRTHAYIHSNVKCVKHTLVERTLINDFHIYWFNQSLWRRDLKLRYTDSAHHTNAHQAWRQPNWRGINACMQTKQHSTVHIDLKRNACAVFVCLCRCMHIDWCVRWLRGRPKRPIDDRHVFEPIGRDLFGIQITYACTHVEDQNLVNWFARVCGNAPHFIAMSCSMFVLRICSMDPKPL